MLPSPQPLNGEALESFRTSSKAVWNNITSWSKVILLQQVKGFMITLSFFSPCVSSAVVFWAVRLEEVQLGLDDLCLLSSIYCSGVKSCQVSGD